MILTLVPERRSYDKEYTCEISVTIKKLQPMLKVFADKQTDRATTICPQSMDAGVLKFGYLTSDKDTIAMNLQAGLIIIGQMRTSRQIGQQLYVPNLWMQGF